MGQESSEVKRHIDEQRQELGANIHVLQSRVRDKFDWRTQFERRPMTIVGAAFGVGRLMSGVVGRKRRGSSEMTEDYEFESGSDEASRARGATREEPRSRGRERISQALDSIQGALIGVAASKVQDLVERVIPGFSEHYERAQGQGRSSNEY